MKEKAIQHQSLKEYGFVMRSIYEVCETVTDYVAAGSFADLKKNVEYLSEPNYAQLIRTVDLKSGFLKGNFVYVNKKAFDYLWRVNLNCESIILPNIGNCGEVYYVVPEKLPYKNNVLATNAILVRSLKESNKYLFYIFQSKHFQDELKKITSPVGQTKFNKTELKNICIPIPSRKVQEEIVKILDSFTNLIDALNEELSLRQKQFEYYREKLLTFDEEPTSIFKFTKVLRGKRLTTKELSDNAKYPVYHGGTEPIGYYNEYNRDENTVMVINVGASAGTIGFCNQAFWSSDGCYCLSHNQKIDNKFLYYSLLIREYKIKSQVRYAGIPTLDQKVIENIQLFIPSLAIQQSIVEKLDAFESLIASLKEEIALRQKQYEYYREKLLTFD